jgi:hypothetical protein
MAEFVKEKVANEPVKDAVATGPPDFLAKKHPHERDSRIKFYEEGHRYTVDGLEGYTSVTTWNHHHFPKFDADSIIGNMEKGKYWRDGEKNKKYWDEVMGVPMTREKIKEMWDANRDAAAKAGTAMHYDIECYYNGIEKTYNVSKEYQYFKNYLKDFERDNPHLIPYRTEWTVFDEEMKLTGSIDMVYMDTTDPTGNTLAIYDWKRCAEISHENKFSSALTPEIKHLPDTNFWHYSLQLNTYKTILERNYGKKITKLKITKLKITKLALVVLHPQNANYQIHDVPIMEKEMNDLFEARRTELSNKI